MAVNLLQYRPWRGRFRGTVSTVWPIARVSLGMILRRRIFWALYAIGLLMFFMFFLGQYLLAWAQSQAAEETIPVGFARVEPDKLIPVLRNFLKLNGSPETYCNFFFFQGYMVMIILALAGSILVGNDFQFGSLPFYLAKPLGRWHYLLGKCLAVAVFVNLMTTLPAVILFVQFGLLDSWSYFTENKLLLAGILGYGLVLTCCLSLMLVTAASWLRRTIPLIMTWTTLFFFFRLLARVLVDGFHYDVHWRLIDLWNDTYLLGSALLGIAHDNVKPMPQPAFYEAALVLGGLCLLCLIYLSLRIRSVEIVR